MKKYLIILSALISSTLTYADLTTKTSDTLQDQAELIQVDDKKIEFMEDILATAPNYTTFEFGFSSLVQILKEHRSRKDYEMLCEVSLMMHEFLVNNIKYSQEFNSKHPDLNYESLLNKLTQDNYDNKDGCTGKAYFYK